MLRVLHTSDWHLGHTLHDLPREQEQAVFLDWLRTTLEQQQVDVLLIAGDVFDVAHPPAAAQRQWYAFLAEVWRALPQLQVVVIGGNHDSAARLDAPRPMLEALGRLHVVGCLPRRPDRTLDEDTLLLPLKNRQGQVEAWVAAIPYLRPADLESGELIQAVRAVHSEIFSAATRRRTPEQALIATGHAYLVGGQLSERSERKIQRGNQEALPLELYPLDEVTYVALGHLHLTQKVGGRENIRYSGAPLPLAMDEAPNPSQVLLVTLDGPRLEQVQSLPVPRSVAFLRIPARGFLPPQALESMLLELPKRLDSDDPSRFPYLEVGLEQREVDPAFRARLGSLIDVRRARLVKITRPDPVEVPVGRAAFHTRESLHEVSAAEVLEYAWAQSKRTDPLTPSLRAAFAQLEEWAADPKDADLRRAVRPQSAV